MPITQTAIPRPECHDKDHKVIVFFNEDNLNYIPTLLVANHTDDEIDAEKTLHSMKGKLCACMEFVVNWKGAARVFVLPDPAINKEPPYKKFLVCVRVEHDVK